MAVAIFCMSLALAEMVMHRTPDSGDDKAWAALGTSPATGRLSCDSGGY